MLKKIHALPLALACGLLASCPDEGPMEEAGETLDEAAEDTGEAIEDAADEVEDEVDEATDDETKRSRG